MSLSLWKRRAKLEPEIPPPELNYNQTSKDPAAYAREYKEAACLRELPFMMKHGLTPASSLFDYGCGLGRHAYAASKYLDRNGAYYGFEPNPQALAFLKNAYKDRPNFRFSGAPLEKQEDYIAMHLKQDRVEGAVGGDVDFSFIDRPIDVQWSCSVFTHMRQDAIVNVLKAINSVLAEDGVCINTWLCIDEFAAYVLRCGLADRSLPFNMDGGWTYSRENPLMCIAYELSDVQRMYEQAGQRIIDIIPGSWAGRDNGVTYQDIVISKPLFSHDPDLKPGSLPPRV